MSNKPLPVDLAISKANALAKKGAPGQARQLYQEVLKRFPGNKRATEGLKSLPGPKLDQGKPVLDAGPTQDQINGLIALYNQRRLQEALEQGTALAGQYPAAMIVHNVVGAVNADLGYMDQAVASYTKALQIKPDYAEAHGNLGNALVALGKHHEAIASYTRALQIKPDYAEAHGNLGNALLDLGEHAQAIASYTKALQIKSDFAEAHYNLGNTLKALERHEEAIASYTRAVQIKPNHTGAHSNLGNSLRALGKHEAAIASYTTALMIKPDFAEAHSNLGHTLVDLGRHEEAVASYTAALRIKPDFAEARRSLGMLKKYRTGDPRIVQMLEQIANPKITDHEKMHLSFALGKAYDDLGDAARAFKHLLEGNRLRKKEIGYDIRSDRRQFGQIKSIFGADDLPSLADDHHAAECKKRPIFIVGMPRSGTTLAEQILASHSQVHGAGELKILSRSVMPILNEIQELPAGKITAAALAAIRSRYLTELDNLGDAGPYITDKMPLNFRWIGFILTAMPEAKIINLQRDPVATCWSIFTHYFSSKGNGYAYDLADVAEFYKLYVDLMDFWRERFPNQIYDLNYDALTENQREETQRLLDYCGLEWEPECLEFHKTERAVKTASSAQVRQAMYQGSSAAWRKYEAHIQPMLQALER
jgi:tetratricopeptide (TPR) repeat protein